MEDGMETRMEQGFSERLKRYRKEKNLTQQQLADALGVSNKSVSRWESGGGYPDLPLLVPLAKALGVTADDLLDEEKPVRALLPLFGFALLAGFWAMYLWPKLPLVLWQRQGEIFTGLLAVLAVGYALALKRRLQQLLAALLTLGMSGGVWWLRQLDRITWVQSLSSGKLFEWNSGLNMEKYLPLIQPLPALFAALAALAAVYLLAAGLTLRENEQSGGVIPRRFFCDRKGGAACARYGGKEGSLCGRIEAKQTGEQRAGKAGECIESSIYTKRII